MANVQDTLDKRSAINQQLFDALHQELKGYRDGFLLEVLQKPLVRDLVCLFDDLSEIRRQIKALHRRQPRTSGETAAVPGDF